MSDGPRHDQRFVFVRQERTHKKELCVSVTMCVNVCVSPLYIYVTWVDELVWLRLLTCNQCVFVCVCGFVCVVICECVCCVSVSPTVGISG